MYQRVLVIDDSDSIHTLVKTPLLHDRIEVYSALDGAAGISLTTEMTPDLILLDVDMPGLNGFEVCRRLKSDPTTESIPVLFLTSDNVVAHKIRGLSLGAVDYLTKPFEPGELRARVHASLRTKRRHDLISGRCMADDLTKLWNKVYFNHRLRVDVVEARRFDRGLACILLDVDRLRSVNEQFGRDAGDAVLRTLAIRLLDHCRAEDTAFRLAGGAFAVLSPNTRRSQAMQFAVRLWHGLASRPIIHDEVSINVKCSFGVASFLDEEQPSAMVAEAHAALDRAKHAGGNQIVGAVQMVDESAKAA
jgi:two-component system cell cycle response regulator